LIPSHSAIKPSGWPGTDAHVYNSSYSGGRDQEDPSLKPAGGNSSQKRAGRVAQGVDPEFKLQYCKKKKTKKQKKQPKLTDRH
jgi:hypothetical protein